METPEPFLWWPPEEGHTDARCEDVRQTTSKRAFVILSPENGYELPEGYAPVFDNQALMFGPDSRYG